MKTKLLPPPDSPELSEIQLDEAEPGEDDLWVFSLI